MVFKADQHLISFISDRPQLITSHEFTFIQSLFSSLLHSVPRSRCLCINKCVCPPWALPWLHANVFVCWSGFVPSCDWRITLRVPHRRLKDLWCLVFLSFLSVTGNEKYYSTMSVKEVLLQKERPKFSGVLCKYISTHTHTHTSDLTNQYTERTCVFTACMYGLCFKNHRQHS